MKTARHSDPALCQSPGIGAGPHSGHTAGCEFEMRQRAQHRQGLHQPHHRATPRPRADL